MQVASCSAHMAQSTWTVKTKKQSGEPEGSPTKVLCTTYEKNMKKMEGDLSLLKDPQWLDRV